MFRANRVSVNLIGGNPTIKITYLPTKISPLKNTNQPYLPLFLSFFLSTFYHQPNPIKQHFQSTITTTKTKENIKTSSFVHHQPSFGSSSRVSDQISQALDTFKHMGLVFFVSLAYEAMFADLCSYNTLLASSCIAGITSMIKRQLN